MSEPRRTALRRDALQILLVSDLHLRPSGTSGVPSPGPAFARFLEHLTADAKPSVPHRLVLLGDVFDLPIGLPCLGSEAERHRHALDVLDDIVEAHRELFLALRRFVAGGGRLDFVVGNHELPLRDTRLQDRLRHHLGASAEAPETRDRVAFHSWFLMVPDVFYAEHGHQYHDINSVLNPTIGASADLPLTALVDVLLCVLRPGAHRGLSIARRIVAVYRTTGTIAARFAAGVASDHGSVPAPDPAEALQYGAARGVDAATVARIHRLRADPGVGTVVRVARLMVVPPFLAALPIIAFAAAASRVFGRLHRPELSRTMAVTGLTLGALVAVRAIRPPPRSSKYLQRAAASIGQALIDAGQGVPYLVFGHTHLAEFVHMTHHPPTVYLNCGSWVRPGTSEGGARAACYSLVRLLVGPADAEHEASVCEWDDVAGRIEPFGRCPGE